VHGEAVRPIYGPCLGRQKSQLTKLAAAGFIKEAYKPSRDSSSEARRLNYIDTKAKFLRFVKKSLYHRSLVNIFLIIRPLTELLDIGLGKSNGKSNGRTKVTPLIYSITLNQKGVAGTPG
jgi:hypothetical protein